MRQILASSARCSSVPIDTVATSISYPFAGATPFDLGGLQADHEDLLGVPVDLVTPGDLPAAFRVEVLVQARPV